MSGFLSSGVYSFPYILSSTLKQNSKFDSRGKDQISRIGISNLYSGYRKDQNFKIWQKLRKIKLSINRFSHLYVFLLLYDQFFLNYICYLWWLIHIFNIIIIWIEKAATCNYLESFLLISKRSIPFWAKKQLIIFLKRSKIIY